MSFTAPKAWRGDGAGKEMKAGVMHQKDADVRQVELNPFIKEVAEKVVGKW